ncbi:MAG: hypothetical protein U9M90_01090 [Patescibacteria group bacterium]|nr:hypothetical protein [Patescibacteria group bacterium]
MKKIKKTIAAILITTVLFLSSGTSVHAGYWSETFESLPMKQGLEEVFTMLRSVMLSTMQREAIKQLKRQVEQAITGTTGESQMIADYEDFIYVSSYSEEKEYLSDFFATLQEGVAPGEREMLRNVEQSLEMRLLPEEPTSTLHEIVQTSDPIADIFDQRYGGGVKALMSYEFGDYNNPYSAYLNAESMLAQKMERISDAKRTEAMAGLGFKTHTGANSVMPGSIYQHLIATAEAAPMEMITNATTWQQVLANLVTGLVVGTMKNGIKTNSSPSDTDKGRINRSNSRGYSGIQTDIYQGR